jgi:hypothetical protein
VLDQVVHGDHRRMPHPGRDPGLDQPVRPPVGESLDRDVPVQQLVLGAPHPAGRAVTDQLGHPVAAGQQLADR